MVDEERESNRGVVVGLGPNCEPVNGSVVGIENGGVGEGTSARSSGESLRTYKRRKHAKMSGLETKLSEGGRLSVDSASQITDKTAKEMLDVVLQNSSCERVSHTRMVSHASMNGTDNCSPKHWRNIVLEQMYQSLSESDGGLQECIRDALVFHQESSCTTAPKESVHMREDRHKFPSQTGWMLKGTQNAAKGHVGVMSNGLLNESNKHTITEMCQRTFFDIIVSEEFAQLCNLLFENFQGMKVDSLFDVSLINSRMKEGAYDSSPILFYSDIQQVWTKLQKVGTEMVALAKGLSDKSRTSYCQQVGGSVHNITDGDKHEFLMQESDMHAKPEQTEVCGMYKVCTCRHCGEKADGRDCLVCDYCEEMYHVSCIEPAVEIPPKTWYCAICISEGHVDCVLCERLNVPSSPINGDGVDEILTNEETLQELESSNGLVEDGLQPLKGGKNLPPCKMCRIEIENGEKFRICGHPFCPHKYYHVRCLTSKQLNSYGSCWYCPSCLCRACLTDRDDDKIVLCDYCDHAYHIYCLQPPRTSIPRGKWLCRKCDAGIQRIRKAKRAYESKMQKRAIEGKWAYENLKNVQEERDEDVLDKSGGVDMLLTAAKTISFEENLLQLG